MTSIKFSSFPSLFLELCSGDIFLREGRGSGSVARSNRRRLFGRGAGTSLVPYTERDMSDNSVTEKISY